MFFRKRSHLPRHLIKRETCSRDKNNRFSKIFDQARKREKMDVEARNMEDMSEGDKGGKEDPTDTSNGKEITRSSMNFGSTMGRVIRNKKVRVKGHMGSGTGVHDPRGRKGLRRERN